MPTDSGFVDSIDSKNRHSFHQWAPQHSLSGGGIPMSRSMSLHLHSTSRRVFIGPTPVNWNYKKRSFLFSKGDMAVHHRQKTFRAEDNVIGPTDTSSLDYRVPQKERSGSPEMITDKTFMVSEPLELIDSDVSSPSSDNEAFYTPAEVPSSKPITPMYHSRENEVYKPEMPSSSSVKSPPYLMLPPSIIEIPPEGNDDHLENAGSTSSANIAGTSHLLQDNGHLGVHNIGGDVVSDTSSVASFLNNHDYEPGSVIKEDRMLVRVEHDYFIRTSRVYDEYSSKHNIHSAGWREFIVRLRPEGIELYRNRKDQVDKLIFSSKIRLSLYSAVDYTLSLTKPCEHGLKIFILRPRTRALSTEWYLLFYRLFPKSAIKPIPSLCEVSVPDLDVKVRIPLEVGDNAFRLTAEEVMKVVLDQLSGVNEWEDVLNEWMENGDLRLCWKRYDRLEWIIWEKNDRNIDRNDFLVCPQFIEGTHQLQMRTTQHYPTSVTLANGIKIIEPPPVEGYLIRITNNKGRKRNAKRLYFSTHDHYFFFMKPIEVSPPPPPRSNSSDTNDSNCCSNQQPLIYAVTPQIQGQVERNASFMKADLKRRHKQVINAAGFIDLTDVVEIRPHTGANNGDHDHVEGRNCEHEAQGKGSPFELVMKNNTVIILQTYSHETREEWIKRLNDLVQYWKARVENDVKTRINLLKVNQGLNKGDNDHESVVDDDLQEHFNKFKLYADPAIWNWCVLNECRTLTKSGSLYHKSHLHGTFQKYHHILTRGHLIYFDVYSRSLSGRAKKKCYHKLNGIINLSHCYVYSGCITEYDLLYTSSANFNLASNGEHTLPRIYEDGMCCYDCDEECTFVIWKGEMKSTLEKANRRCGLDIKKEVRLNHPGKAWVFRARSRIEREEWVWALNVEIERLCETDGGHNRG